MFVHLHLHTTYSTLDGMIKPEELGEKCAKFNMPAVAITDHGNIHGWRKFYKAISKHGVKPILGCEAYLVPDRRSKLGGKGTFFHLTLLATNQTGYHNLIKLITEANLSGFYHCPRIDYSLLEKYQEGLICLSGCLQGEFGRTVLKGGSTERVAARYKAIFGDRFYLEVMRNTEPGQEEINSQAFQVGKRLNIKVATTCDAHYLNKEDADCHNYLWHIATKTQVGERRISDSYWARTPEEMRDLWSGNLEAIENTLEIAERCNVELKSVFAPPFVSKDQAQILTSKAQQGLSNLFKGKIPPKYQSQLDYELSVINKMDLGGYLLIVEDYVNWAKNNGVPAGAGRGSGAGSVTVWSLGLTAKALDPLKYGLIFERFLNPERISLPDIDTDFCVRGRDKLISHLLDKYGNESVAHIVTFGTLKARSAIRDIARIKGLPYDEMDRLAKLVPEEKRGGQGEHKVTLKKAIEEDEIFRNEYRKNPVAQSVYDDAQKIEGLVRSVGIHASGIGISLGKLSDTVPLFKSSKVDIPVTQWDMRDIEEAGLVKFDILGLDNVTIINDTAQEVGINLDEIPLDDPKVFDMICEGDTHGVFQLSASGMTEFARKFKPRDLEDLSALVALYRPGPLDNGMCEDIVGVRDNTGKEPDWGDKRVSGILEDTSGVLVYQEQVMKIARELSGYNLAEADILRKAMGKKLPDVMRKQEDRFTNGCIENKIEQKVATELFSKISKFSDYCLAGDTEVIVLDENGESCTLTIEEIVSDKRKVTVVSLTDRFTLIQQEIEQFHYRGNKDIYCYTLRNGRSINCTEDHEVLGHGGVLEPIQKCLDNNIYVCSILGYNKLTQTPHYQASSIKERVLLGSLPTYDIGLRKHHNFLLANGMIVSNCFNKAHSLSYGYLSYLTAYLKVNYPIEYISTCLTIDKQEEYGLYISDAFRRGIKIRPPTVGLSRLETRRVGDEIVLGLGTIKGMPAGVGKEIGKYTNLKDFNTLRNKLGVTKASSKVVELLAKSGATDNLGVERGTLVSLSKFLIEEVKKEKQGSLYEAPIPSWLPPVIVDEMEEAKWEAEVLGYPLNSEEDNKDAVKIVNLLFDDQEYVTISGLIVSGREIITKKGFRMYIGQLRDQTGEIKFVVFPKTYTKVRELLTGYVILSGRMNSGEFFVDQVESGTPKKKTIVLSNCPNSSIEAIQLLLNGDRHSVCLDQGSYAVELGRTNNLRAIERIATRIGARARIEKELL